MMRLQRLLARAGVTSRRKAEALIEAGRVRVDGCVATLGQSVDPDRQRVTVDGRAVRTAPVVWYVVHKPVGVAVTRRDPEGRPTVFELVADVPGLTYVGRLDIMTSGLLLMTTDGAAVHRLTHPSRGVPRTYRVRVRGKTAREIAAALRSPVVIGGRRVVVEVARARASHGAVQVELTVREGRNRIVRRICEYLGLQVLSLHRLAYGPIRLGRLASGRYRTLTAREQHALK